MNTIVGCTNGGGQAKPSNSENPQQLLARVNAAYQEVKRSDPEQNLAALKLYKEWTLDGCFSPVAQTYLHTEYHQREKMARNPLAIQW